MTPLGVEHRQRAEARAHADGSALDRHRRADRGQDVAHERAGVARGGGVPLVALARREQRDPVPRQLAGGDAGAGEVRPAGPAGRTPARRAPRAAAGAPPGLRPRGSRSGPRPRRRARVRGSPAPRSGRTRHRLRATGAPSSRAAAAPTSRRTPPAPGAGCRGRGRARRHRRGGRPPARTRAASRAAGRAPAATRRCGGRRRAARRGAADPAAQPHSSMARIALVGVGAPEAPLIDGGRGRVWS